LGLVRGHVDDRTGAPAVQEMAHRRPAPGQCKTDVPRHERQRIGARDLMQPGVLERSSVVDPADQPPALLRCPHRVLGDGVVAGIALDHCDWTCVVDRWP